MNTRAFVPIRWDLTRAMVLADIWTPEELHARAG